LLILVYSQVLETEQEKKRN